VELLTRKGFTMKRLSVLLLVAVLALVGWALPAGAEKVRLTEDQMDNVSAGLLNFTWPRTLPVDQSREYMFDWGTEGVGGGVHFGGNVQVPCQTGPSLACMGAGGGGGGSFGPWGAGGGGGGSMNLFNWGGPIGPNSIVQFTGGGGGGGGIK
jgi:hypothetical protein